MRSDVHRIEATLSALLSELDVTWNAMKETRTELGKITKDVATLQGEDFLARLCEIRSVDQAVVAAADHDYVIVLRHSLESSGMNPQMLGDKRCGWKTG